MPPRAPKVPPQIMLESSPTLAHRTSSPSKYEAASSEEGCVTESDESERNIQNVVEIAATDSCSFI